MSAPTYVAVPTADLNGAALDWAVAKAAGLLTGANGGVYLMPLQRGGIGPVWVSTEQEYRPSTLWLQGGPIVERERISVIRCGDYAINAEGFTTPKRIPVWAAVCGVNHSADTVYGSHGDYCGLHYNVVEDDTVTGPTLLTAAMRCFVASKLGNIVQVPAKLVSEVTTHETP